MISSLVLSTTNPIAASITRHFHAKEIAKREVNEVNTLKDMYDAKERGLEVNTKAPTTLTRTSTTVGTNVDFFQTGASPDAPFTPYSLALLFSSSPSPEFSEASNGYGYVYGNSVSSMGWGIREVPDDSNGVRNVLKSVKKVCDDSRKGQLKQHREKRRCAVDPEKVYVINEREEGEVIVFKVDVDRDVWEEIRIPKTIGGWKERLVWLR